ncbi:MAG: TRAP transporter TatT component family protein [Thermoanaerobaculia bacterium]
MCGRSPSCKVRRFARPLPVPFWSSVLLLSLVVPLLTGCSVRALAVRALGNALAGAGDVFASDEDPELVREAVPFALKTMEALLAEQPEDGNLLLAACKGFVQYGYGFVETDALLAERDDYSAAQAGYTRALGLYLRGRDYCLRSLELMKPGVRTALVREPGPALAGFREPAVPLLYWTGAAWGAAIGVGADRPDLVADVPAVKALIERALALDEDWNQGAAHAAMIALEALPAEMGGAPKRAREHFARALELDGGRRAGTYVTLAMTVVKAEQDANEFRDLLERALAVDPDAEPSARVENLIAQQRARYLLAHTGDYFVDYTGE